jgi:hypothetical protein
MNERRSQLVTNRHQLEMAAGDGKRRLTDVANKKVSIKP